MKPRQFKRSFTSSPDTTSTMFLTIMCLAVLLVGGINADEKNTAASAVASATKTSQPASPTSTLSTHTSARRDEIYIDDEGLEGSGGHGELHDLEKDSDYSGSGFGPDDEDSDLHNSHHQSGKTTTTNTNNNNLNSKIHDNNNEFISSRDNNGVTSTTGGSNTRIIGGSGGSSSSGNTIDDDDFDLDGEHETGSGDGAFIDRDDEDGDDDGDDTDAHELPFDREHDRHHLGTLPGKIDNNHHDEDIIIDHSVDTDTNKLDTDNDNDDADDEDEDSTEPYDHTESHEEIPVEQPTHKPGINNQGTIELDTNSINSLPPDTKVEHTAHGNEVLIMSDDDRTTSFFAQPGILAAVIGGAVVGLLCAILVVMFIVYRMRKKDEGSYALDEPKRSPAVNSYAKNANNREFYA